MTDGESTTDAVETAIERIEDGGLAVYPTETVYGLGADGLDPAAVEAVFEAKQRDRSKPVSLAVASVEDISSYARLTDDALAFCEQFLPGPVTVVLPRRSVVPDVLVAGAERVGVRVPDHDIARRLIRGAGPLTATSANRSGQPSARQVDSIDETIRDRAAVVDGGETPGGESTVVDPGRGEIIRPGLLADEIEAWLDATRR
ncbi:MAG: L-threonylcarbamoyladenylate synthase [Natronomonas sp.]